MHNVSVVVGDATATKLADVDFTFVDADAGPAAIPYANKPEIKIIAKMRIPDIGFFGVFVVFGVSGAFGVFGVVFVLFGVFWCFW